MVAQRRQKRAAPFAATLPAPAPADGQLGAAPRKRRPKKPPPAPVFAPNACHIVAVDPGENSGWATWKGGKLVAYGECDVFTYEPLNLLIHADWAAEEVGLYPVLVVERPFSRRLESGGFDTTNIGAADKVWRAQAKRNGYASRIVRVYPARWRAKVLPGFHAAKRKVVKAEEVKRALPLAQAAGLVEKFGVPGPDASAAILIGQWAVHSGEVAAALPKRPRARKATQ